MAKSHRSADSTKKSAVKKEVDFTGQMVMVSALTAALVTVVLLCLWFFTFGFTTIG